MLLSRGCPRAPASRAAGRCPAAGIGHGVDPRDPRGNPEVLGHRLHEEAVEQVAPRASPHPAGEPAADGGGPARGTDGERPARRPAGPARDPRGQGARRRAARSWSASRAQTPVRRGGPRPGDAATAWPQQHRRPAASLTAGRRSSATVPGLDEQADARRTAAARGPGQASGSRCCSPPTRRTSDRDAAGRGARPLSSGRRQPPEEQRGEVPHRPVRVREQVLELLAADRCGTARARPRRRRRARPPWSPAGQAARG